MAPLLELVGVRARYGRVEVLEGIDLAVGRGSVTALLGPNGAGKSTVLGAVAGTVETSGGIITFAGRRIDGRPTYLISRAGVTLVPESRGVFPGLTVAENLEIGARAVPRSPQERAAAVTRQLDRFPVLGDRLSQRAGTLSGGERQMLALARALLASPRLLLLDEMSAGLAPAVVHALLSSVRALRDDGVAVLVAEQFAEYVLDLADLCYVLGRGAVTFVGEPAELRADPSLLGVL